MRLTITGFIEVSQTVSNVVYHSKRSGTLNGRHAQSFGFNGEYVLVFKLINSVCSIVFCKCMM